MPKLTTKEDLNGFGYDQKAVIDAGFYGLTGADALKASRGSDPGADLEDQILHSIAIGRAGVAGSNFEMLRTLEKTLKHIRKS